MSPIPAAFAPEPTNPKPRRSRLLVPRLPAPRATAPPNAVWPKRVLLKFCPTLYDAAPTVLRPAQPIVPAVSPPAVFAAKKIGAVGAGFAGKTAGGLTAGTIGWAGRRTVGAASYNVGQNLSKTRFGQTAFGGAVARGAGRLGTKSLDLRGLGFVGSGAKAAGIGDIGKPDKDALKGYKGQLEAAAKKRTDYAESLEMTDEEKIKAAELKAERERIENKKKKSRRELDGARNEIEDNEKKKARLKTEINDATAREAEPKLRGDLTGEASARSAAVTAHDALDQLDEKARSDAAELARIQSSFASEDGAYRKRLDEIKEDIEKNDPKGRYARSLVSTSKVMPPFTGN